MHEYLWYSRVDIIRYVSKLITRPAIFVYLKFWRNEEIFWIYLHLSKRRKKKETSSSPRLRVIWVFVLVITHVLSLVLKLVADEWWADKTHQKSKRMHPRLLFQCNFCQQRTNPFYPIFQLCYQTIHSPLNKVKTEDRALLGLTWWEASSSN
jgi:hypothetical protein